MGETVWGDGFAHDSIRQRARTRDWDRCDDDELARLLPALPCLAEDPRREIVRRLERIVAARPARGGPAVPGEDPAADALAAVVSASATGAPPPYEAGRAALFGFASGLHPGYLWPEARLVASAGTAACWLGIVCRGRPAFLVPEVAEALGEALAGRGDAIAWRDGDLARLPVGAIDPRALRRLVDRHARGDRPVMRLRAASIRLPGGLADMWRRPPRAGRGKAPSHAEAG